MKKCRPRSETRDNILEPAIPAERSPLCSRLSTPNLPEAAEGSATWSFQKDPQVSAVRTAVLMSKHGFRHEIVKRNLGDENFHNERQRLLSSPKHSRSYPALKRLATSSMNSQTSSKFSRATGISKEGNSPGSWEPRLGRQHRHNSDITVGRGSFYGAGEESGEAGKPVGSSMVKSGSFLRQLGDRLWSPLKRGADLTLAFRRSVDRDDLEITSPLTPPSPPSYGSSRTERSAGSMGSGVTLQEGSRSGCQAGPVEDDLDDRVMKGGKRALLIQKIIDKSNLAIAFLTGTADQGRSESVGQNGILFPAVREFGTSRPIRHILMRGGPCQAENCRLYLTVEEVDVLKPG
ncbi:hypothetical protein PoB_004810100 [Plakobranchus ocellatus]|uniref:Uncharacterized protein n=1 Tax=Plakobranchus ocellatus TaxID=259542 RepID=A0AAV4BE11_9GAST|nr:hypothetical protein PoB_004810100 [Plakobranchus ocellatus]